MEITINGDPKEIATLVLAVQERRREGKLDLSKIEDAARRALMGCQDEPED